MDTFPHSIERVEKAESSVQVYVVWIDDGVPKILIGRRIAGAFFNQWSVPGGKIDPGEDAHAAALRELEEETGMVARREELQTLPPTQTEANDTKGGAVRRRLFHIQPYRINISSTTPPEVRGSPSEFSEMKFVSIEEALGWGNAKEGSREILTPVVQRLLTQILAESNTDMP